MINIEKTIQVRDKAQKNILKLQAENCMLNMDLWAARRGYPYIAEDDHKVIITEVETMEM